MTSESNSSLVGEFIKRWKESGAAERANYQLFLSELTDLLEVPRPQPAQADDEQNTYVFERAVIFNNGDGTTSPGRIDLYKRGCFVLEAKQGSDRVVSPNGSLFSEEKSAVITFRGRSGRRGMAIRGTSGWDIAMRAARGQAEQYIRALPPTEENPPFIIVVDVGHSFELYSDFSRAGRTYLPFPDARSHRISINDLDRAEIRERLRLIWTDPLALDPSRRTARVTRQMAERLADLARSLEKSGHSPERVANFLMRAIFTMFAEDVKLLPANKWTELLESLRGEVVKFPAMVSSLWETMNAGGFSPIMREHLLRFNGGLFESFEALPITERQLDLLIVASKSDWRDVEPAIFGTLLERALDPLERQLRGAHFTPRGYVERLVMPTVIEPLREEWDGAQAAAITLAQAGRLKEAAHEVKTFHRRLCKVRVLDPACGSGNFLYVTLEHLKRLEGEVLDTLHGFGEAQGILEDAGMTVDPHQLMGIEKNPRATAITDLVLWIGYLQWHFRTRGEATPPEPVIRKFHNIECRDAVLAYDEEEIVTDESGQPLSQWDGRTYKKHAVTGEDIPDEEARIPVVRYSNPRKAEWPQTDFIVGNPPFIGARRIRTLLGDEYVETLRKTYSEVPETCDYVMYWWHKAAGYVEKEKTRRFGFITTNSIVQQYSSVLIEKHLHEQPGIRIVFAIPDHPWVESSDGAAVRVAMTVGEHQNAYKGKAILARVVEEDGEQVQIEQETVSFINALLLGSPAEARVTPLRANERMCFQGVVPAGDGFKLDSNDLVSLGYNERALPAVIHSYIIGRDLVQRRNLKFIIDFFGMTEAEARDNWPALYQRLLDRVYPERQQNNRAVYRDKWWIFAEPRPAMRKAIAGLSRFIATPYTAVHRPFIFVDADTLPDAMAYAIASDDGYVLGVLSSRIHRVWSVKSGGTLEDRPRYNSRATFSPFPFPKPTEQQKLRIRELAEALDAHRKRQQKQTPELTITDMYNVLDKINLGDCLDDAERETHEKGLISILGQIHADLDSAVSEAYGWSENLTDDEILAYLGQLNAERAEEERTGLIRWLRPDHQKPSAGIAAAFGKEMDTVAESEKKAGKLYWPKTIPEQALALRRTLSEQVGPVTAKQLASSFSRASVQRIEELLETLVSLGQARQTLDGHYIS